MEEVAFLLESNVKKYITCELVRQFSLSTRLSDNNITLSVQDLFFFILGAKMVAPTGVVSYFFLGIRLSRRPAAEFFLL